MKYLGIDYGTKKIGIAVSDREGRIAFPKKIIPNSKDIIQDIDLVCIMSVNPGFGGQSFIESTYEKVSTLKEMIVKKNAKTLIEIDGGVTSENARKLIDCGADVLVAGSFVFKSDNPIETIENLKTV